MLTDLWRSIIVLLKTCSAKQYEPSRTAMLRIHTKSQDSKGCRSGVKKIQMIDRTTSRKSKTKVQFTVRILLKKTPKMTKKNNLFHRLYKCIR